MSRNPFARLMPLSSDGICDPGCVRKGNQDRILRDDELGLYIVCDGLGGRRRGDIAADMAIDAIRQYVESSVNPKEVTWPYGYNLQVSYAANRILTATQLANRQVWRRSEESLEYLGMGTTISAVLVQSGIAAVANIGDSRVYLSRNGLLDQVTVDDTVVGPPAPGEMTEPLPHFPIRNILTHAAGSQENAQVHLSEHTLEDGDVLLLCSDGLHGCVDDQEIRAVVTGADTDIRRATAGLLAIARSAGAPDNVSVVMIAYSRAEA